MKFPKSLLALLQLLLAVLVVFVGLKAWNAYAEHYRIGVAVRDRDTFSVEGTGKVTSKPDLAIVNLGVQTDASTVRAAQDENTRKMNAIIAAVKALGVKNEDITTENYSIYPRIDWTDGRQRIMGYTVSQSLSVKIRDLDKIGDVLAQSGDMGANQVGGINFTIDEPKALQAEARQKAIADARMKADELAKQLGLTIVKVVSFSESSGGGLPPIFYAKDMAVRAEAGNAAPDIQTGTQDVVSNVSVVFEIN